MRQSASRPPPRIACQFGAAYARISIIVHFNVKLQRQGAMIVDEARVAQYHRDGYLLLESVFSEREVKAMLHEVEEGQRVAAKTPMAARTPAAEHPGWRSGTNWAMTFGLPRPLRLAWSTTCAC
jgi:hypothetical protein